MPYSPPPELSSLSIEEIAQLSQDRKLPPVDQWAPASISDSKMQILPDGRWFHDGGEIKRASMIRAFASLLRKDDDGFWLVTPYEKQSIIVDDAPFVAVELSSNGAKHLRQITVRTNTDDIIVIGPENPIIMQASVKGDLIPYVLVRGELMAKCGRNVTYELYELAIEESGEIAETIGIYSGGIYFDLSIAL